jgi:hypothetical protein
VEQELLTLSELLGSPPVFSGVRILFPFKKFMVEINNKVNEK